MKALMSLSGGIDSTTVLATLMNNEALEEVTAVGFRYPSKHNHKELLSAYHIANHYEIPLCIIEVEKLMHSFNSALLHGGEAIPEGHYEEESMRKTVVPARNMLFISVLTGLAISLDIDRIYIGIHAGDHAIYPDCRPEFFLDMAAAVTAASEGKVTLCAPFLNADKKTVITQGLKLKAPYHLTWTCYKGEQKACGKCGSCVERKEAFTANGVADPAYV